MQAELHNTTIISHPYN